MIQLLIFLSRFSIVLQRIAQVKLEERLIAISFWLENKDEVNNQGGIEGLHKLGQRTYFVTVVSVYLLSVKILRTYHICIFTEIFVLVIDVYHPGRLLHQALAEGHWVARTLRRVLAELRHRCVVLRDETLLVIDASSALFLLLL